MALVFNIRHLSGSLAGQSQRLVLEEGKSVKLGRNPDNDLKFSEQVDDMVSGVHAVIQMQDGRLYVIDQRSSNGTFINGSPCPPFEKIAVPDGSRLRLGKNGPEMQLTLEATGATAGSGAGAGADIPPPPPPTHSSLPPKKSVGRETLLREIDRAKQEERDLVSSEIAKTRKSTGAWMAVGGLALAALILIAAGAAYFLNQRQASAAASEMTSKVDRVEAKVGENIWAGVEQRVRPAVAHIRCRYHLERPQLIADDTSVTVQTDSVEVTGSAVLIRPGLLLTAKHVVEPWRYAIDWSGTPFAGWDEFADKTGITPVYETFVVQFPGLQPITGTISATAETSDLALVSVPNVSIDPVRVVTSNSAVKVTDDVAIIGFPLSLGERRLLALDFSTRSMSGAVTQLTEMDPIFLKGTVTRAVPETGDSSHHFSLDASVEPGNSGGPVLNRDGDVVGIVSQKLVVGDSIEFQGQRYPVQKEVRSSARCVSPNDMEIFLSRAGVL